MASLPALQFRRWLLFAVQFAAFALILRLDCAEADATAFLRRFHVWGHFRPGSWVVVRQGSETIDPASGSVVSTSTTETRTTLKGVDERGLTFRVQASLEVGGKKLDGPAQEVRQGLNGESAVAGVVSKQAGEETIDVQGKKYRCRVEQTESTIDGKKTVVKVWNSSETAPFELRRLTTVVDALTDKLLEETSVEVVSISSQRRILARARPVAEVRITTRHPRGQTTAVSVNCPEVPGGVVTQTAEEFDSDGRLIRRTKIELVDFETH